MLPMLQLRSFFWRYLRGIRRAMHVHLPTPRLLLFPFIQDLSSGPLPPGGRVKTAVDGVNLILSSFPTRWPLPIPVLAVTLVAALSMVVNAWVVFDIASDLVSNNELFSVDTKCQSTVFDYVVVGAGTAGIVVATRIANASRNIRVLLLEAGGEPSILNDVPSLDLFLMNQPANTWKYASVPQENACHNCDGMRTLSSTGKMLGGSSSTNFMMYTRGNREDFNRWAIDAQDPEWNYENILPYFKKSEDYNGAYANEVNSEVFHGNGGLLNIATHTFMPGVEDFLAAGVEKGYSIGDYNGEDQEVFSKVDVTTQDNWRESVYRAFYQDTGKPPNLCIKKYAHVTRINFGHSATDGRIRATGVIYHRHNLTRTVEARNEVIISAGTFGSAKLLLLSGIGPSEDLRALGIPIVRDVPDVGKNLQDHSYALVGPFVKGPAVNPNRDLSVSTAAHFVMNEDGVTAAPFGLAGQAFFQSPFAQPAYPDLQAIQFSIALHPQISHFLFEILGIKESILQEWLDPFQLQNLDARFVLIVLGRPHSVGQLSLSGAYSMEDLIIDPNYLSHPEDREVLLYGFKKIVDLFENTTVLKTPLFPKPVRGCEHESFKSDDYFRCVIKHMSGSLYDHVGTCALGKVVDSRLRVHGIDGLRVIDASVIPRTPNGNVQAATIMVAEKGAEFIVSELSDPDRRRVLRSWTWT